MFSDLGVTFSFVDFRDAEIVKAAIRPNTKLIFSETPANPTLTLTDIRVGFRNRCRFSMRRKEGGGTVSRGASRAGPWDTPGMSPFLVIGV